MSPVEQIQQQLLHLPPDKQSEVLDFISFLQQQQAVAQQRLKNRSLRKHPAFGAWRGRQIAALDYQHKLRAEWEDRA